MPDPVCFAESDNRIMVQDACDNFVQVMMSVRKNSFADNNLVPSI
jgi:hypothetical protein